jgi:uncharacterized membrane protein
MTIYVAILEMRPAFGLIAIAQYDQVLDMICPNCEAPMPDISAFCPACGVSVAETAGAVNSRDRALGALAYVGLVPAIVLLLIPGLRENRFVSFHSWQSVLFTIASALVGVVLKLLLMVLAIVPMVGFLLAWLLVGIGCMGIFILWIVLVVKAALGNYYQLPLIGPLAEQLAARADS